MAIHRLSPFALLATLFVALVGAPDVARAQSADEAAVRAVEDRRIKALVGDDFATLEAIFADDLQYTHSSGVIDDKTTYMAALKSGKTKYESVDRGASVVRIYGDTAVMTGTAVVGLRGRAEKLSLRYTLVYVRKAGEWRFVAWQSTRTPPIG